MKYIILTTILMLLCAETFASGCITGYACSLSELNKQENTQNKNSQNTVKDETKDDKQIKTSMKKDKKQKEYQDLFIFTNLKF